MERTLTTEDTTRVFAIYGALLAAGREPREALVMAALQYMTARTMLASGVTLVVDGATARVRLDGDAIAIDATLDPDLERKLEAYRARVTK